MGYRGTVVLAVFILCTALTESYNRGRARYKDRKCEKITIPLCQSVGYNSTYMPNRFGQKTQADAGLVVHQFYPLVLINCSPLLKHFVCSLYAPMCDPVYFKEIVPCRSFCEEVRDSCSTVMQVHGFPWPEHLQCSQFPTREENNICMRPTKPVVNNTRTPDKTITPTKAKPTVVINNKPKTTTVIRTVKTSGCGCMCKSPYIYTLNISRNNELPLCALQCQQYFFTADEMKFVTFWLGLWSIIAFIGTVLTTATFLIDRSRFSHTERPIVIISFCYILVAFGYVIRLIYGHESIACNSNLNLIRYSATGPAQCTSVFFLTYFFTNVAWIWWVFLSMNWFLSTGLKWPSHVVSKYSQYFHFFAWIIPTVQTMAILAMAAIDGDPVSGICSVGNHDNNTLTIFVIAPLLIYTMLSFSFFVAGILAIYQGKKLKSQQSNGDMTPDLIQNKTQCKYISKIGVFTFVLFVPAFTLIGCYFYEHNNKEQWKNSRNCPCIKDKVEPNFYIYLLKYFMSLMIGLVSGFWILDTRTIESWKSFLFRFIKEKCHENNNLLQEKLNAPVAL